MRGGLTFDIAHLLAGTLVLVSFLELYQDRLYASFPLRFIASSCASAFTARSKR
jgi:hypothetical protein